MKAAIRLVENPADNGRITTESSPHLWVMVLAAGEGARVRCLTCDRSGHCAPKQFCSVDGRESLLASTLERAMGIAPRGRIVVIVAAQHRGWWDAELSGMPSENIIVQPGNRGTAVGILLPLLSIVRRDRQAIVVILPSDHFVESETTLRGALKGAVAAISSSGSPLVLMGIEPQGPEEDYGWIVPSRDRAECPHPVVRFVEKPDAATAARLLERGAFLNSFIMVAHGHRLLSLYEATLPQLSGRFQGLIARRDGGIGEHEDLARVYDSIPSLDFSRQVLERAAGDLSVYPVPPCGWSDLGTPQRLNRHLTRWPARAG